MMAIGRDPLIVPENAGLLELRVNDLKQYAYCPRVVYYQYVMPVEHKATYKMEKGKVAQEDIQTLEKRRKLKRYNLAEGRRSFDVWLYSRKLGLSGKLDLLVETDSECFPVDFKWTPGTVRRNHILQLGGYSLLVEDQLGKKVSTGFVYLLKQGDVVACPMTRALKDECLATLEKIRAMIRGEDFPSAAKERAKCIDCEYRNFCRDIW